MWCAKVDTAALAHDRDQLFAEAVHLFRQGEQWWPDGEFEREHITPEQEQRYEADAWEDGIARFLAGLPPNLPRAGYTDNPNPERPKQVTVMQVAHDALVLDAPRLGTADQRRIAAAMERLGWWRGARGANGERFWYPPADTAGQRQEAA